MLFAQNTDSKILKLDPSGKATYPYSGTSTSGSLAMSKTGALFVLQRATAPGNLAARAEAPELGQHVQGRADGLCGRLSTT